MPARPGTGDAPLRPRATRSEVARLAGVSTAVVSYVVNDGPRPVAAATAVRVREAMSLLGYVPNAAAQALRRGATGTVGLVIFDGVNPYVAEYVSALSRVAGARGTRLLIGDALRDVGAVAGIVSELVSRQVDGLLLTSMFAHADRTRVLQLAGVPTVLVDCPTPLPGHRTIGADAQGAAEELVGHLVEHGRRRIAMVIGDGGYGDPDPRELGWRRALRSAGLPEGASVGVPFTREGGHAALDALLEQDPMLDAVFASSDLQAFGLLLALHERGIRVPEDVAVVAYDGTAGTAYTWPPLTVARQPLDLLAGSALDLLEVPEAPEGIHVQHRAELVRRASCGCTPAVLSPTTTTSTPL